MKYINTPEKMKANIKPQTDCALCSEDPQFCGNQPECPALENNRPCREEMVTLCLLCSEDPRFCGPSDLF